MTSHVGDRLLWVAVVAGVVGAYWFVPTVLRSVREQAVVPDPPTEKTNRRLPKAAEEKLTLSTLRELADGTSHELRACAIKITADRFFKSDAKDKLLADLKGQDERRRGKAIHAMRLLLRNPALHDKMVPQRFTDEETFSAIVAALINILPLHNFQAQDSDQGKQNDSSKSETNSQIPPSPVRVPHRPAQERLLLRILNFLLQEGHQYRAQSSKVPAVHLAVEAGLITKWLVRYPFPCVLPGNAKYGFKKSDVCHLLGPRIWGEDDWDMAQLVQTLLRYSEAEAQLQEVGLRERPSPFQSDPRFHPSPVAPGPFSWDFLDEDNDVRMVNGETTAGLVALRTRPADMEWDETWLDPSPFRVPATGRSPEEESMRRRHREAIVVAEAGAPLRPENILQRPPAGAADAFERTIQEQQESILRHRAANARQAQQNDADRLARERIDGLEERTNMPFVPGVMADVDLSIPHSDGMTLMEMIDFDDPTLP